MSTIFKASAQLEPVHKKICSIRTDNKLNTKKRLEHKKPKPIFHFRYKQPERGPNAFKKHKRKLLCDRMEIALLGKKI